MTDPARVADLVTALLRDLPAADVAALVEGRARLTVVPLDATPPADLSAAAGHPDAAPAGRATPAGRPTTARTG
ncbi:hypothetical protein V6U77_05910, partial [Micromonospora sp. CPCC 205546]|uniref:hypothetical protein n=1 Tax=Micromonospora sp. CPCC 205546 TaxID=3122397 RepID=UPI002FEE79BD